MSERKEETQFQGREFKRQEYNNKKTPIRRIQTPKRNKDIKMRENYDNYPNNYGYRYQNPHTYKIWENKKIPYWQQKEQRKRDYYDRERSERRRPQRNEKRERRYEPRQEKERYNTNYQYNRYRTEEPIKTGNRFQVLDEYEDQDFWTSKDRERHKREEEHPNITHLNITYPKRRRNSSLEAREEENTPKKERRERISRNPHL
ncbi:Hypothetical predicted protein [Pelobates cultripes]|uniref:Uncharacterized protein n=1 Tax=Pelobates cultripes TaxID=61616 RepID=A0AAD1RCR7_PELCU|nr:Hypothetical predicted protein [Pelobates cultripes]